MICRCSIKTEPHQGLRAAYQLDEPHMLFARRRGLATYARHWLEHVSAGSNRPGGQVAKRLRHFQRIQALKAISSYFLLYALGSWGEKERHCYRHLPAGQRAQACLRESLAKSRIALGNHEHLRTSGSVMLPGISLTAAPGECSRANIIGVDLRTMPYDYTDRMFRSSNSRRPPTIR